jgi:hypothetical protein
MLDYLEAAHTIGNRWLALDTCLAFNITRSAVYCDTKGGLRLLTLLLRCKRSRGWAA